VNAKTRFDVDYIIVGQGLAGSLLAWELRSSGQDVLIYDNNGLNASSMIASGLLNPVTGQRLHADENVHALLQCASTLYRDMEKYYSLPLLHNLPMRRYGRSNKDNERWTLRRADPLYRDLIGNWITDNDYPALNSTHGCFEQLQCARLDIPALIKAVSDDFSQRRRYRRQKLNYQDIKVDADKVTIDKTRCRTLIFCQGHQARGNPWFHHDAWNISRGDILHFRCKRSYPFIANHGFNYIPMDDNAFHWGSSFDLHALNVSPTQPGMDLLLRALVAFDRNAEEYQLIAQYSGLRPASRDKRPLIGRHTKFSNLAIFNGFGARGSLLIPYYAHHFSQVLTGQSVVHPDVDYQRFNATQYNKCDNETHRTGA